MADVSNIKPIVKEDYPQNYHDLIDKLAFSLNPFMRQVVAAFSGQVDISNLTFLILEFTATVDASGIPKTQLLLKVNSTRKLKGLICINATNQTDDTVITGTPFFTYTISGDLVTVTMITGLPANKKFNLVALAIR